MLQFTISELLDKLNLDKERLENFEVAASNKDKSSLDSQKTAFSKTLSSLIEKGNRQANKRNGYLCDDTNNYTYFKIYKGYIIIGSKHKSVIWDPDGTITGGVNEFHLVYKDDISMYVQVPIDNSSDFDVGYSEKEEEPIPPFKFPKEINITANKFLPPDTGKKCDRFNPTSTAAYRLRLLRQSQILKADSTIDLNLKSTVNGSEKNFSTMSLKVLGQYSMAPNVGLVTVYQKQRDFRLDQNNRIVEYRSDEIFPVFTISYWPFCSKSYIETVCGISGVPAFLLGFNLKAPTNDIIVGISLEPVTGIQLLWGGNFGQRVELSDGQQLGDILSSGKTVSTRNVYGWDQFFGFSFDLNFLGKKLISYFNK